MDATELREQLCAAIRRRSLVMFEYGDLIRVVEPHRFGINSAGHEMLSGWLRAGYSRSDPAGGWRNYLLSDVSALQVLDAPFAGTRPGYAAHDARMREVYCELESAEAAGPTESPFIVREPMAGPPSVPSASSAANASSTPDTSSTSDASNASNAPNASRAEAADMPAPLEHPSEAARTRDGEVDPPTAAT